MAPPRGRKVESREAFFQLTMSLVYAYHRMHNSSMNFTWDEPKRQANLPKHGLEFADAAKVFAGPVVFFEDDRFDYGKQRIVGVGLLDYLVVMIVHVDSDTNHFDAKRRWQ